VLDQTILGWPVVVRRNRQDAGRPDLGRTLGQFYCGTGVVAASAGHDRYIDCVYDGTDELDLFVVGERRAFSGRARDDQTVVPVCDEPLSQLLCALNVE